MFDSVVFKIIILGQQGVGKSSILNRYTLGNFSPEYTVTIGVEFSSKNVTIDQDNTVKLQIWDTVNELIKQAGQETFRAVVRSFYRGIAGVFLVYSIDRKQTFIDIKNWYKEVKQSADQEVVFFLVGCKADLEQNRQVSVQSANQLLKYINGMFFIETSAKSNINVNQLFQKAAQIMYKKYISNPRFKNLVRPFRINEQALSKHGSVNITSNNKKDQQNNCCLAKPH